MGCRIPWETQNPRISPGAPLLSELPGNLMMLSVEPVALKLWSLGQQSQHHPGACWTCRFSGPTPDFCIRRSGHGTQQSVWAPASHQSEPCLTTRVLQERPLTASALSFSESVINVNPAAAWGCIQLPGDAQTLHPCRGGWTDRGRPSVPGPLLCTVHSASTEPDHRAGLGGTACPTEGFRVQRCRGRLRCSQVLVFVWSAESAIGTTAPASADSRRAVWAGKAGVPGRVREARLDSPGGHHLGGSLGKAAGLFSPERLTLPLKSYVRLAWWVAGWLQHCLHAFCGVAWQAEAGTRLVMSETLMIPK